MEDSIAEDSKSEGMILATEINELKVRLENLVKKQQEDPDIEPECVSWNLYEQAIHDDPIAFLKLMEDQKEAKLDYFKRLSPIKLVPCLRFFTGDNIIDKKRKLMKFLRLAPGYRTKNLRLLEQRLYVTRKWMKEHNIQEAMEDIPNLIKS